MGLSLLTIPEDAETIEINTAIASLDEVESDMEGAGSDSIKDSVDVLIEGALALESIYQSISSSGIDRVTARNISGLISGLKEPGLGLEGMSMYDRLGGSAVFTTEPSLEGLHPACESIAETIKESFKKLIARIVAIFKAAMNWVKNLVSKTEADQLTPSQKAKDVTNRANVDALVRLLDTLSDNPAQAAQEVARMAGGETTAFANGLQQEFENLSQRLEKFFDGLQSNNAYARVAAGVVSVRELLKQEADQTINGIVGEVSDAAQAILKTRNAQQLQAAMERGEEVLARAKEMSSTTFNTKSDEEVDAGDAGLKLGAIISNLKTAVKDTESTNIKQLLSELLSRMDSVMRTAEQTSHAEVAEFIPEDADDATRQKAITLVMSLYGSLSGMSKVLGELWGERVRSLRGITVILENVSDIISSLERGISRLARPLEQEQKDALIKALLAKGITIEL